MIRLALLIGILFLPLTAQAKILDIRVLRDTPAIQVWLIQDQSVPVISMQFAFKGQGSRNDPDDKQGLYRLLSNTMDEGAGNLDSQAFQKELNDHGIELSFSATRDNFIGTVYTLSREKERAFRLLGLALSAPRFDEDAIERMRAQNISRLRSSMTDPEWMLARLTNSVLFDQHLYAKNSGGTLSSLPRITKQDLKNAHQTLLTAPVRVAIAGDITDDEALEFVEKLFPTAGTTPVRDITHANFPQPENILFPHPIPQTLVTMALPGPSVKDPDYVAAEVMNYILGGGGFGSRLMDVIRERNGLTYGIYSNFEHMDGGNFLSISSSSKNETIGKLVNLTKVEIDALRQKGINPDDLRSAVRYLRGSTVLNFSSNPKLSNFMLGLMLEELPVDYLDKRDAALIQLDVEAVNRAAEKWLDSRKLVTIMLGKPTDFPVNRKIDTLPNVQ